MHLTTRRVILQVEDIRSRPDGRTEAVQRRVLALLRAFLEAHPQARRVRELAASIERDLSRAPSRITFGQYASEWLARRRAAGEKMALAGALMRQRLEPVFGSMALRDIRPADVKRWAESAGRRESRSFLIERDLLRAILIAAAAEKLIERVPGEPHLR
jgi:hypothetical protein